MLSKSLKLRYITLLLFTFSGTAIFAQRDTSLTQEVEVIKSYKPRISDAFKINEMPAMDETEQQKPTFNYSIFSQPIYNAFSVNTLKAATFRGEPDKDNGYGLVKAGLGNYSKPYGEIFFNSQNIKNTLFGIHGKHLSSHGKINLEGGDRVKSPFAENEVEMFIKNLSRNSILSVNLGFDHNGFNYYGYPKDSIPSVLKQKNQQINYLGSRQTFSKGSFNINLNNAIARRNDFVFDFNFLYHYFGAKTGQREHFGEFAVDLQKPLDTGTGLLEASATFVKTTEIYNRYSLDTSQTQQIWFTAKPAYFIGGDVASIRLGLNLWYVLEDVAKAKVKLSPNIKATLTPVEDLINIFAGIDGNYINNHYSKIAYENPFIDPTHDVRNTFEKYKIYGGFDGKFSRKTNFKLSVDYSIIKDQPLYYLYGYIYPVAGSLPDPTIVDNDFDVLYDDIKLLKFNLELFHTSLNKLDFRFDGNYYVYKMDAQEEAWNMPDWDATVSLGYKISEQLSVSTDLFLTGKRQALIVESTTIVSRENSYTPISEIPNAIMKSFNLNTVVDLNFSANYKITSDFSLFAQLHNFGFEKYQRWLGYPVQSLNFLGGLSYSF